MTYLTPSRDALAKVIQREYEAASAFDPLARPASTTLADALIATGAVVDATTLADDEALVTAGWNASTAPIDTVAAIYRALAAALAEREAQ